MRSAGLKSSPSQLRSSKESPTSTWHSSPETLRRDGASTVATRRKARRLRRLSPTELRIGHRGLGHNQRGSCGDGELRLGVALETAAVPADAAEERPFLKL